ncbi:hypothetical protein F511_41536 [Dorcoceras hygrometricum]|uniref:Uncharacterized protein n=1 Tax=Dorcoceras hygrometricum TaxID=472368 RepID=A0A2Z7AMX5_9LAMI|nr:hypothetical protein F511_41536 [Dorcoceras hygrometricum]
MPELEELQAADDNQRRISVQGMVDRIEGQSHGQPVAKRPAVPHGHTPDKDVADLEEASKVMAEGILVYVKAVVSHITQSTNQRNFQHKEPKQGVGSSGAGPIGFQKDRCLTLKKLMVGQQQNMFEWESRKCWWVYGQSAEEPIFSQETRETYYPGDVYHRMSWAYQREEENCLKLQPVSTHKMHGYSKKNESTMKTQRVRATGHHDRPRFVLPPRSDVWRIAQHKKFHKSLTRTQKRRMLRQRAAAKPKTTENTVSKSKSCIKATEDKSSKDGDDMLRKEDAQENRTIDFSVGKFHISVDCNTEVVIFPKKFKLRSVDEEKSINHRSESVDTKQAEIFQESSDVITREEHPTKPKVFPTNDTMESLPSLYALLLVNSPANFQALLEGIV